jgi:hypothetical protein
MKPASPSSRRSAMSGMLASALSITARLARHNWRRTRIRRAASSESGRALRKGPRGRVAASGDHIILLTLLILFVMLANRQMPSHSPIGDNGLYDTAVTHMATAVKTAFVGNMDLSSEGISSRDYADLEEFCEDIFDPSQDDLF